MDLSPLCCQLHRCKRSTYATHPRRFKSSGIKRSIELALGEQGRKTFEQGVREDREQHRQEAERLAEEQRRQAEQDRKALERAACEQRQRDIDEFERRSEEHSQKHKSFKRSKVHS